MQTNLSANALYENEENILGYVAASNGFGKFCPKTTGINNQAKSKNAFWQNIHYKPRLQKVRKALDNRFWRNTGR